MTSDTGMMSAGDIPTESRLIPGRMITKENADTYVPWRERVPHTPLREGLG